MKLGPYELDSIVAGECASLMDAMPKGCIDLTVTSPPYDNLREYQGYVFDFEAIARQLWRVTKPGGVVVWVVGDATVNGSETGTSFRQALYFMQLGFNLHDTMIYESEKPTLNHNRYEQKFEFMFVVSKGRPVIFNPILIPVGSIRNRRLQDKCASAKEQGRAWRSREETYRTYKNTQIKGNVWQYPIGGGLADGSHPASFPKALARDHILSWSNPGDIVLDPMCGSGTTCKMAKELGRHWLGFDISPEYVEIARKRVEFAKTPLFNL